MIRRFVPALSAAAVALLLLGVGLITAQRPAEPVAPAASKVTAACELESRIKSGNPPFVMSDACTPAQVLLRRKTPWYPYNRSGGGIASIGSDAQRKPIVVTETDEGLVLIRCATTTCSSASTSVLAEPGTYGGGANALAVAPNGTAAIGYHNGTTENDAVRLVLCQATGCDHPAPVTTWSSFEVPALAYGPDGLLRVLKNGYGDPAMYRCADATCSTIEQEPLTPGYGLLSGDVTFVNGLPVIAYVAPGEDGSRLVIVRCHTPTCSSWSDQTAATGVNAYPSVRIRGRADGTLYIATFTTYNGVALRRCTPTACDTVVHTDDGSGAIDSPPIGHEGTGGTPNLVIDSNGIPSVAYRIQGALRVARCDSATCSAPTIVIADGRGAVQAGVSYTLDASGRALLAYVVEGRWADAAELRIAACTTAGCT